ncbi:hypothetical protein EMIT0P43_100279 [Pseudomonas jessenii]
MLSDMAHLPGLMNKPHEPLPIYPSSAHPLARLLFPQRSCTQPIPLTCSLTIKSGNLG